MKTFFNKLSFLSLLLSFSFAESFQRDLDFIRQTLYENHPGVYNTLDPNFTKNMDLAYQKAAMNLSENENFEVLMEFGRSFDDSHLRVTQRLLNQVREYPEHFEIQYWSGEKAYYIKLPTFFFKYELTKTSFEILCQQLSTMTVDDETTLVIDLRGNKGGNSAHGTRLLSEIFGTDFVEYKRYLRNRHISVDWRASRDNKAYIDSFIKELTSPQLVKMKESFQKTSDGMQRSIEENEPYYSVKWYADEEALTRSATNSEPRSQCKQIVVLIDRSNNSAALTFIDDIMALNIPCILVGEPTKKDRFYIEVRQVALPSGKGDLYFPIKVYRNRPRGDNQGYVPQYFADWSTEAILENNLEEQVFARIGLQRCPS